MNTNEHSSEIYRLQKEVARILNVTLRGDFRNPEDREFWVKKARELNGQLNSLEQSESNKRNMKCKSKSSQ